MDGLLHSAEATFRLARDGVPRQLSRTIRTHFSDTIFWLAVACCALAQAAIIRSAFRARAQRPDGSASPSRPMEIAWTVVPALMLALVLVFTWRTLHSAPALSIVP